MAKILILETATEVCSVALSVGGEVVAFEENGEGARHSGLLTLFVEKVLAGAAMKASDLNAVCVSRGPGSYTGLRIGVSAAKGLCYALQIPLLAVSTLNAMAAHAVGVVASSGNITVTSGTVIASEGEDNVSAGDVIASSGEVVPSSGEKESPLLCPMLDARRMEVYTALFDARGNQISDISAMIIGKDSFLTEMDRGEVFFFGNGASKCREVITHPNARFIDDFHASARFMSILAQERFDNEVFESVPYFEPFYLKDFIATIPKNKVL